MPQTVDILPLKGVNKSAAIKLLYIDNLKVVLTTLVVMHHTFITYGAPGGWYFSQKTTHEAALIPMTLFVAVNQSFFMGFFFFISAYFTESSYQKKGAMKFITDRLKRLGIPLLFYSFILSPVLNFIVYRYGEGKTATFMQYLGGYDDWIDFGVLWFVAALLLFSLIFVAFKTVIKTSVIKERPAPKAITIILFAIVLSLITYGVRTAFPVGWVLKHVGFQFGHFTQYIALFCVGILASRYKWLNRLQYKTGKLFAWLVGFMVFIMFPLIFYIKTVTNSSIETFNGLGHWQSLMYALWEQLTGVFIMAALVIISMHKWSTQSGLFRRMSRAAFGVYIFHPLVLIFLSVALAGWQIDPAYKLLVVAPLAVTGSFVLSGLLLKVPGVDKII